MKPCLWYKLVGVCVIIICITSLSGCTGYTLQPTPTLTNTETKTPTATSTITKTPTPSSRSTKTATQSPSNTPEPTSTATLALVPTSSVKDKVSALGAAECRSVVDGLYALKSGLGLPEHFTSEDPVRKEGDFNPNRYFAVLKHLKMASGYSLDYLYFGDDLGGKPLLYARKSGNAPFKSYEEFLQSFEEEMSGERSYSGLAHAFDYLEKVQIDRSPESYFQFSALALLGDQFYLFWHGLYNDTLILCDETDMQYVDQELAGFEISFPDEVASRLDQIDYTPAVIMDEDTVTVRFIIFTKWGGFYEYEYVMDREDPMKLVDVQFNSLIEYDCGINF